MTTNPSGAPAQPDINEQDLADIINPPAPENTEATPEGQELTGPEKPEAEAEEKPTPATLAKPFDFDFFTLARQLKEAGCVVRDGRLVRVVLREDRKEADVLDVPALRAFAKALLRENKALAAKEAAGGKPVARYICNREQLRRQWPKIRKDFLGSAVLRRVLDHEVTWSPETVAGALRNIGRALAHRKFFNRCGAICRLKETPGKGQRAGKISLLPLSEAELRTAMVENGISIGSYKKRSQGRGEEKVEWTEFATEDIVKDRALRMLTAETLIRELPVVDAFRRVRLPVLHDGTLVLVRKGYDWRTRTLTIEEVEYDEHMPFDQARKLWQGWLKDFPWSRKEDKAVALGYAAALFASALLPEDALIPGLLVEANCRGAGKTALARLVGVATEGILKTEPLPTGEEEVRKAIFATFRSGSEVWFPDNSNKRLSSASLAAAMTSTSHSGRVLGESRTESFDARLIAIMTGIQTKLSAELHRRFLTIRLHAKEEKPECRTLDNDFNPAGLKAMRRLVAASLWAIVREWDRAGRPRSHGTFASDYRDWHALAGGIAEFAGFGAIGTPAEENDEETADAKALFSAMAGGMGLEPGESGWRKTAKVLELARELGLFPGLFESARSAKAEENAITKILTAWIDRPLGPYTLKMRHYRPRLWNVEEGR